MRGAADATRVLDRCWLSWAKVHADQGENGRLRLRLHAWRAPDAQYIARLAARALEDHATLDRRLGARRLWAAGRGARRLRALQRRRRSDPARTTVRRREPRARPRHPRPQPARAGPARDGLRSRLRCRQLAAAAAAPQDEPAVPPTTQPAASRDRAPQLNIEQPAYPLETARQRNATATDARTSFAPCRRAA